MMDALFSYIIGGFWGWFIVGVLMMIVELFIPGVFIVWIGIGALLTGIVVSFFRELPMSYQLLIFAGFSTISVFLGWFAYGKAFGVSEKEKYPFLNQGAKEYIGKSFPLVTPIEDGQGQVKIGDSVWPVKADKPLKSGEMVTVDRVDGIVLHVSKKGGKE